MVYDYKPEDSAGRRPAPASERNRTAVPVRRTATSKRIRYGNRRALVVAGRPITRTRARRRDWMFEVVFDYGDHDQARARCRRPLTGTWPCRPDPFSTYRPGFEVRTYRRCQRMLMFHHFPDEPGVGADYLVRSTDLTYEHRRQRYDHAWRRSRIPATGGDGGGYSRSRCRRWSFGYSPRR